MAFLSKFGRSLRSFGTKVSHGVRVVGNKVGNFLLGASPVLGAIPGVGPELAALSSSVGGTAKDIAALGGTVENALSGKGDINEARRAYQSVKSGVGAVRDAYTAVRGRGSRLEKGG